MTVPWLPIWCQEDTPKPGCDMVVMLSETCADDCIDQPSMTLVCPAASTMGACVVLVAPTATVAAKHSDDRKFTIIKFHDCRRGTID